MCCQRTSDGHHRRNPPLGRARRTRKRDHRYRHPTRPNSEAGLIRSVRLRRDRAGIGRPHSYLGVLDDAAFGAATEVTPKFIAPADPATRWTAAHRGPAFFAYSANYLIDTDHAIIVDVEATTAIRQAETTAAKRMVERSITRFDLYPERLIGDTAYGRDAELAGQ